MVVWLTLATTITVLVGIAATGSVLYLLLLLVAALPYHSRPITTAKTDNPLPKFVVVVPAHNEEVVLADTLLSLREQEYPAERATVVVIADNCTDRTAPIAHEWGATVLTRYSETERGKGYALAFAFADLLPRMEADWFVIVDADTQVAPNFLRQVAGHIPTSESVLSRNSWINANGCAAWQGRYGVLNDAAGWRAALMSGAFDLVNHVKLLGADRLHLAVGLKGNGMIFNRQTLTQVRWQGHSITEDIDFGLDLLRHDVRIRYLPQARVQAQMPTTARQSASQRARWEGGRYRLLRERFGPLLWEGIRRGRPRLIDAALGLLVPPLSELAALLALWGALIALGRLSGIFADAIAFWVAWIATLAGFVVYVLGGFAVAGAGRGAYAALVLAPFYALWKFALYGMRLFRIRPRPKSGGGNTAPEWVRTERTPNQTRSIPVPEPDTKPEP